MKTITKLLVLTLSLVYLTGMAQQQATSGISYKNGHGVVQKAPSAWEACPTTSFFSQPPVMPDGPWEAFTSDAFFPYLVYENFTGITQPIGTVHFWGLNLLFDDGWFDCSGEDPMTFEIKFYPDNAGLPGAVLYTETLTILRDATGLIYAGYPLYHYKAVLTTPVNLAAGWISIQGVSVGSPTNCDFLWMNSQVGDNLMYQQDLAGGLVPQANNVSLCFEAGNPNDVPLAPWALVLGAVLIAGSVFLRYRRII
jgi:hypothetical protein